MSSLLERALGEDWSRLAPTLKAHYPSGPTHERGEMTVEFPPAMRAPWWCLSRWGALVDRRGEGIRAEVRRFPQAGRERWQRTLLRTLLAAHPHLRGVLGLTGSSRSLISSLMTRLI